jgi:hypothetical protein
MPIVFSSSAVTGVSIVRSFRIRRTIVGFVAAMSVTAASTSWAAKGDCGQPITNGSNPVATDALGVLRAAVGLLACMPSVCDVDSNGSIAAGDALRVLRFSVGHAVALNCPGGSDQVDIQCSTDSGSLVLKSVASEDPLELTGDLTLSCDDPADGGGDCTCVVENIAPMPFLGAGVICVTASDVCSGGSVDCNGGSPRQTDLDTDHNIGSCVSNAACEASCGTRCAGLGKTVFQSGCERFCVSGTNADAACTSDAQCPGSSCAGPNHEGICGCQCIGAKSTAAPLGHFQCQAGLHLTFEFAAPCGDGDEFFIVGDACLALSSESVTGKITQANNADETVIEDTTENGSTQTCQELSTSGSEGLSLVGIVPVLDSPIGDLLGVVTFPCE